jgi:sigma-B regulation protein RsbU (phosphoserine phosphatase)
MKHSYFAASTALPTYMPVQFTEPHAASAPSTPAVPGIDCHGDIRSAGDSPSGFLNFQSQPEFGIAVSLADVASRASDPAPIVSRADSLLHALTAYEPLHPETVVEAVNRAVCGLAADDSYLTLFHAWMDPTRGELRYVNAGHEPAILFRKRRHRVTFLEQTGTVLGLTPRAAYGQRSMPIDPGDALVVFTAGLAETANIHGSQFGAKGVIDAMRRYAHATAASIASLVLDEAERHAGWAVRGADHGIAVIRFVGERERPVHLETGVEEPDGELVMAAA